MSRTRYLTLREVFTNFKEYLPVERQTDKVPTQTPSNSAAWSGGNKRSGSLKRVVMLICSDAGQGKPSGRSGIDAVLL